MPLPTSAKLTPLDPARRVRELTFIETPVVSKQARFKHRRMLIPDIDLKAYRFKAVIDFIVVRVFTQKTQRQWIQEALREVLPRDSWIVAINSGAGMVAEEFDITIQDPHSTAVVIAAIEFTSPFLEGTMYLGAKDTSRMIRVQNKVKDQQYPEKGTFNALGADEARARVEVTLQACDLEPLGLRELRDLESFSYSRLQRKYFQFMLPTFADDEP